MTVGDAAADALCVTPARGILNAEEEDVGLIGWGKPFLINFWRGSPSFSCPLGFLRESFPGRLFSAFSGDIFQARLTDPGLPEYAGRAEDTHTHTHTYTHTSYAHERIYVGWELTPLPDQPSQSYGSPPSRGIWGSCRERVRAD